MLTFRQCASNPLYFFIHDPNNAKISRTIHLFIWVSATDLVLIYDPVGIVSCLYYLDIGLVSDELNGCLARDPLSIGYRHATSLDLLIIYLSLTKFCDSTVGSAVHYRPPGMSWNPIASLVHARCDQHQS